MEDKIKYISSLIYKSRLNDLRTEEKSALDKWLEESECNKKLFEKLNGERFLDSSYNRYTNIKTDGDWEQVLRKIDKQKSFVVYLKRAVSYAAVLAVIVSSVYIVYRYMPEKKQGIVKEQNIIIPGSKKAVLTLADGQKIQLDDLKEKVNAQLKGKDISVDSNILYYKGQKKSSLAKAEIHKITIPRGAEYLLELTDGTKVWLNSETELRYPRGFDGNERVVYLKGEAFFKVSKDKARPFKVVTENSVTTVLGTEFNVNNYGENMGERTTLVEGSVLVTNRKTKESIRLVPSEQSEIIGNNIISRKVDVNDFVLWKEGKFYFNKKSLELIMAQMERWYDIDVFFVDEELKDYMFTGVINKDYSANRIFEIIEKTTNVKFKIKNNTVTIYKKY